MEKEIDDIENELRELELDSGIRIIDESNKLVFITKSADEFTIRIDDKWFYTKDISEVLDIVKKHTKGKIKAWLY
jgi:dissimilatory sulfite reductase (desulfoviridin) alpha/beta subunit